MFPLFISCLLIPVALLVCLSVLLMSLLYYRKGSTSLPRFFFVKVSITFYFLLMSNSSKCLLSRVLIADTVVNNCLSHAYVTEKEEVMGVLLGTVEVVEGVPPAKVPGSDAPSAKVSKVAKVWASYVIDRSVRLSDRVEVAPQMLINATEEAERITHLTKRETRVVGWYHSHPQITPNPSVIDLNSQKQYQQLESGWVGLIFSVYHWDSNNRNSSYIHCFQTGANDRHVKVPMVVCSQADLGLHTFLPSNICQMLDVMKREVSTSVDFVYEQTDGDSTAALAASGLQQYQMFCLSRLMLEPSAKFLDKYSVPVLREEVKRLEEQVKKKKGSIKSY
ncbi:BRCA1/BRCA2-containing complex subunit 3 [Angomonas deanei]|nr:BRCA1/BRCA2-containing complex subunit 3 [Angomonas deanei]|eukprot:EPY37641.1 BRCA1/BRCA2-containing complex subunit 3 [Angomonas deanei]